MTTLDAEKPVPDEATEARRALAGVGLMALGMAIIPMIDAAGKLLALGVAPFGPPISPLQIAFVRMALQTLFMAPFAIAVAGLWRTLAPPALLLLALRGVCLAITTTLFFAALMFMGLAESISIFFVEPLILTVMSALVLGERIGWRRLTAVALGLVGAMIVIRPNFLEVGPAALLPLGAAVSFATYLLLTKMMDARAPAAVAHLWAGLAGAACVGPLLIAAALFAPELAVGPSAAPVAPIWPTAEQAALLLGLGVAATVGHYLIVMAFARAPASQLAPLQYLEIVSATAFGWWIFGAFPDSATWLGVAIIVASGLFVLHRERVRRVETAERAAPR